MSVAAVELGTVLDFFNGKAPPNDDDGDFVVYGSNGKIGKAKTTNHENAIILGRVGAYCGSVEYCDEKFWASDNTIVVKTRDGFDLKYMYYRLKSFPLRSYAGGAAQPLLTQTILRGVRVQVVKDKTRQLKIASILSAYDNLIENNRRRIQLLEQTARLLYKEWFVHLRFPGHEHVKIKDGVPEGWEKKHLSELLNTQYGFTETATGEQVGPKFLRGTDINKTSYIDWSTVPYCSEEKLDFNKYALQPGDIVVIRMADPGKVTIVESKVRAIFASYLVRLKRKEGVSIPALYLFYVLSDEQYQGFISGASGGSTRKSASAKLLVDFDALVPPDLLVSMFVEQIQPIRNQIQTLLQQNASLKQGRDLLLPRLMKGEITA